MTDFFTLPDRLDSTAAPGLAAALLDRRGQPLVLDASGVQMIGALAMEVIVAAGRQWDTDGAPFAISAASERFAAACGTFGLAADAPWAQAGVSS